jgi:hypothetical protein
MAGLRDNERMNHDHPVVSFRAANRAEYERIQEAAQALGLTVAQWSRAVAVEALRRGGVL